MEIRTWAAVTLLLLGGCSTGTNIESDRTTNQAIAQVPVPTPTTPISPRTNALPRTLKLKLTLDTPADLKVVQGQQVVKEQILSDRTLARERLMAQRQVLLLKLEQLKKPQSPTAKPTNPESSYAEERAKIAQAKLEVDQAQKAIAQFLANSPWTEYAREQGFQPSEKEKLEGLNNVLAQKKASLNLAIAGLQAAKEKHREEVSKEAQQQDTSLEQAQLLAQLNSIESELERFGVVKSPYTGSIKKIKWVGQNDSELVAELTIAVSDPHETPIAESSPRTTELSPRTAIAPVKAQGVPTSTTSSPRTKELSPITAPVEAIAQVAQNSKSSPRTTEPSPQKTTIKPQTKERSTTTATDNPGKGFVPTWEVLNVHDGDTLRVRQGQKVERVRFACIDAPELAQPLGKESRDRLRSLIAQNGDRVALKIVDTDRYGRKVAEVFAGSKFLQAEQVKSGMAYVYDRYLNNCPNAAAVKQAQNFARSSKVGVWSRNDTKPWDYRKTKRN